MPNYTVVCRGGLGVGEKQKKTGSIVQMTEEQAASLPSGTVELVVEKKPEQPKKEK